MQPKVPEGFRTHPEERKLPSLVLVVDDFADAREMTKGLLESEGFRTEVAADGVDAVTKAVVFLPSLIIMDLAMPRLNGWRAIRELKNDPRTMHIPIVALTARILQSDEQEAREAGCDVFLRKPLDPDLLLTTVRELIS